MQLRVPLSSPTITRELFERKLGKKTSELVNQMLITVVFEKPTVPPHDETECDAHEKPELWHDKSLLLEFQSLTWPCLS
jgi:hypothetical protein